VGGRRYRCGEENNRKDSCPGTGNRAAGNGSALFRGVNPVPLIVKYVIDEIDGRRRRAEDAEYIEIEENGLCCGDLEKAVPENRPSETKKILGPLMGPHASYVKRNHGSSPAAMFL